MLKNLSQYILLVLSVSLVFGFLLCDGAYAEYTISVSTSGAQNIDIAPKAGESKITNIGTDSLTVSTTCKAGYYLTMSASVNDNNLYLNGDSANNTSGTYFAPTDGTTTLGNSTNAWGYLMSESTPTASSVFSAVPTLGNAVTLKNPSGTASQTDISDSFNVYYGVSASDGLAIGAYKMVKDGNNVDGAITYYATMAESCNVYTITYNANSGSGSVGDQTVIKGNSIALADNSYTRNNYYFKGWATSAGATTPTYRPGETITPTDDLALYAVWGSSSGANLYNAVASLTRGTVSDDDLRVAITKGNSGVFTYDASEFGASSDASNSNPIYFYRGAIDPDIWDTSNLDGTSGNSYNYPNYVKLGDTCWRIVRTTGSGGVKLVYNGQYGAAVSGSCANTSSTVMSQGYAYAINGDAPYSNWNRITTRAGYTFNNSIHPDDIDVDTSVDTVFGSNSNYSSTNTIDSRAKDFLENAWFDDNLGKFESMLEPSAGYCNDRTVFSDTAGTTAVTSLKPYITSNVYTYFGAYVRNISSGNTLTLGCPRGTVDIYTTKNASDGNKQLNRPIALLTADEYALSGAGGGDRDSTETSSVYSYYSYTNVSGLYSLALSPYNRGGSGYPTRQFESNSWGLTYGKISDQDFVRPAISLKAGTLITSGSGTSDNPWIINGPATLYDKVASMSKGTQTVSDLQATISASNSGVYEYDSSVFGADNDGTKADGTKAKIYYYRGILDSNLSGTTGNVSYGSYGNGATHPNYVKLGNTCWRIVRTTGSGGVKMIYNGLYSGGTVSNSCANATTAAQISTSAFNGTTSNYAQAVRVGYTHNSTYASNSSTSRTLDTLFGSDSSFSGNSTNSTIKDYIENSWFSKTIGEYSSVLESNAGYCNDRSLYNTSNVKQGGSTPIPQYSTSVTRYNFGAYVRNLSTALNPTLGCDRSTVDMYSTDSENGGNGQLSHPVSLLTADEASFAGSGSSTATQGSSYNANSYLRSGSAFDLLSPSYRATNGRMYGVYMQAAGYQGSVYVSTSNGIRPVVSLKEGATPVAGSGTATDPWVIRSENDCNPNRVCYNPNADGLVNSMASQGFDPADTSVELFATNYKRSNYGFAGWNTAPDYSGTFYGPNETLSFTAGQYNNAGQNLYAVWVPSAGTLQNWNGCSSLTTGAWNSSSSTFTKTLASITALTDSRDGNTYAVARLADGNCWMIENLRLESEYSSDSSKAQGFGGVFTGLAGYETNHFNSNSPNETNANSLYRVDTDTESTAPNVIDIASHTVSGSSYAGYSFPRYNNDNTRLSSDVYYYVTDRDEDIYSYGNYYSYAAAKANTTHFSTTSASNSASTSICPKGWHLPTGTGSGEFGVLTNAMGGLASGSTAQNMTTSTTPNSDTMDKRLRSFPGNFLHSGYYGSGNTVAGSPDVRGATIVYWSSSVSNNSVGLTFYSNYNADYNLGTVYPGTYTSIGKSRGATVRCKLGSS